MALQSQELQFLAAWAQEEKAADPYALPAHQLQAAHGIKGVTLIRLIKAWACSTGRRDEDVYDIPHPAEPPWPWQSPEQLNSALAKLGSSPQIFPCGLTETGAANDDRRRP